MLGCVDFQTQWLLKVGFIMLGAGRPSQEADLGIVSWLQYGYGSLDHGADYDNGLRKLPAIWEQGI